MNIRRSKLRRLLAAAVGLMMIPLLIPAALAAGTSINVDAPAGDGEHTFTQKIQIAESTPFAGIQFEATVSDPDAIVINSFTAGDDIQGAVSVSPVFRNGKYIFGFTAGTNAFQGALEVGEISYTYTGSEAASVHIDNIKFVHFPNDGKTSAWLKEVADFAAINISRSTSGQVSNTQIDSIQVSDGQIPLGGPQMPHWAVLNLLLCAAGIVLAAYVGIQALILNKVQKLTGQAADDGIESPAAKKPPKPMQLAISFVLGVVGIPLFLLTQSFSGTMLAADLWTIAFAVVLAAEVIVSFPSLLQKKQKVTIAEEG